MAFLWPVIVLYGSTHRDTHACVLTLTCIFVHTNVHAHTHSWMHTNVHTLIHVHTGTCMYMHTFTHAYSCTVHMSMTSHTRTYTCTYACFAPILFLTLLAFSPEVCQKEIRTTDSGMSLSVVLPKASVSHSWSAFSFPLPAPNSPLPIPHSSKEAQQDISVKTQRLTEKKYN